MSAPDVVAVHRADRLALLDDGRTCPFGTFLDSEGDETEDSEQAVVAIAAVDGAWLVIRLADFAAVEVH